MRLSTLACALAAAPLVLALAGCELFKGNQEVLAVINGRVIGMSAGEFFDRYGRARSRSEIGDGSVAYDWVSAVGYARPGFEGLDDRICRLRLKSDARGRMSEVDVVFDAPGRTSTSRCREIFAAG